jgi:tRNA dimethylallyltransferase
MNRLLPPAIFLMGPTASGKTDLALKLAETLSCEIISVDSAMVYRGMDIGTAKPDANILEQFPHRLIDICDPAEVYSAARFREDALREMADIQSQGRIPLLVGGTFLYFRALEQGLSPLPSADSELRAELEREAQKIGWNGLHERLQRVDPEAAARIHPNDPQRIQRALEVFELTGQPMSARFGESPQAPLPYRVTKLVLAPAERTELHERIALRFRQMLQTGLLEEVETLYQRHDLHKDLPAIRAVGYRQVWEYLEGRYDAAEMQERGIIATRQFAKRQFTWLRSELQCEWFDALEPFLLDKVLKRLRQDAISM